MATTMTATIVNDVARKAMKNLTDRFKRILFQSACIVTVSYRTACTIALRISKTAFLTF